LLKWLDEFQPDVVLLQEIKMVEDAFPRFEIEAKGYHIAIKGQKTYNGVAILSKFPIDLKLDELPGNSDDPQARYIEAITGGVRVASIYLPNGNPVEDEAKYSYKLAWMERLYCHVQTLLKESREPVVLGGDYNIAETDDDLFDPAGWRNDALCRPASRAAWRKIIHLGLTNAYKALNHEKGRYSWWDYRGGAWNKDHGVLIDHLMLSPQAADKLQSAGIDRTPRGWEKPSDHTPVWCVIGGYSNNTKLS